MAVTYGFRIEWRPTPRSGTRTIVTSDQTSPWLARCKAMDAAERWGYRPARWWEYWRWGEAAPTPIAESEAKHGG